MVNKTPIHLCALYTSFLSHTKSSALRGMNVVMDNKYHIRIIIIIFLLCVRVFNIKLCFWYVNRNNLYGYNMNVTCPYSTSHPFIEMPLYWPHKLVYGRFCSPKKCKSSIAHWCGIELYFVLWVYSGMEKDIFAFSVISLRCGADRYNMSSWTTSHLSCAVNTMVADDLTTFGAIASAKSIGLVFQGIPFLTLEGLSWNENIKS